MQDSIDRFHDDSLNPAVRGWLHIPQVANGDGFVLTHGAGSDSNSPLLGAVSHAFAERGYTVLRCDLPFRQDGRKGPPLPAIAERDRAGLRNAVAVMRKKATGKIYLGGHSYGGRQSTILCAAEPDLVSGLLLLSYPLHPPRKPEQLRTQHLPNLRTRSLFVHGTRDPFGTIEEMKRALALIPAKNELLPVEGAGHDLGVKGKDSLQTLLPQILAAFQRLHS